MKASECTLKTNLKVRCDRLKEKLTVLKLLMAKRLAIMVEKPGARQLCAMKPNFSSAKQITSSPCFQSQDGMFRRYACKVYNKKL